MSAVIKNIYVWNRVAEKKPETKRKKEQNSMRPSGMLLIVKGLRDKLF